LLDTPTALAVTDASMLSEHVGTSILVAREGISTLGELNETVKRFNQVGAMVSGVVFNAVRPRPCQYGYGYGKYRYTGYAYEKYTKGKSVE
jgi:tyrosine-protein kinase Etk/Wzc